MYFMHVRERESMNDKLDWIQMVKTGFEDIIIWPKFTFETHSIQYTVIVQLLHA